MMWLKWDNGISFINTMQRRRRAMTKNHLPYLFVLWILVFSSMKVTVCGKSDVTRRNVDNSDDKTRGSSSSAEEDKNPSLSSSSSPSSSSSLLYPVKEYIFHSVIDHFNFQPTTVPTFPLRYYVNDQYWKKGGSKKNAKKHNDNDEEGDEHSYGPCFFYAGNEANIFQFINNSGFIFEAAKEFNALVVFAEHRYYGLSNPFGDDYSLGKGYNISFLTVEQAMEDYNTLNLHLRETFYEEGNNNAAAEVYPKISPFIVFGGSYAANLAMWLRFKNPNLWAGAIASSATPLKHVLRETNNFTRIETEVYANVSQKCPQLIRLGWHQLYHYASTVSGRKFIAQSLNFCTTTAATTAASTTTNKEDSSRNNHNKDYNDTNDTDDAMNYYLFHDLDDYHDDNGGDNDITDRCNSTNNRKNTFAVYFADNIHGWISNALETMVQYGYPYETSFFPQNPLPGYPFRAACEKMLVADTINSPSSRTNIASNGSSRSGNGDGDDNTTRGTRSYHDNDNVLSRANSSRSKDTAVGLHALHAAATIFYNYTGQAGSCFQFHSFVQKEATRFWQRKGHHDRLYKQQEQGKKFLSEIVRNQKIKRAITEKDKNYSRDRNTNNNEDNNSNNVDANEENKARQKLQDWKEEGMKKEPVATKTDIRKRQRRKLRLGSVSSMTTTMAGDDDNDPAGAVATTTTNTTKPSSKTITTTSVTSASEGKHNNETTKNTNKMDVNDDDDQRRTSHSWGYQTCTEVYQPMPTNGITDFEIPYTPNQTEYFARCQQQHGTTPRPNWEEMTFMGGDIFNNNMGSNIFITNGQLDPWRAAGIQAVPAHYYDSYVNDNNSRNDNNVVNGKTKYNKITVRTIEHAAHHLDLRASNEEYDPPSVVGVRNEQKEAIKEWIKEWKYLHTA